MTETASSAVTADRETLRRRVLALSGLWLLLCGMLAALSLVGIALVASAVLLLGLLAVGAYRLLRPLGARGRVRVAGDPIERASRRLGTRLDDLQLRRHVRRLALTAGTAARAVRRLGLTVGGTAARAVRRLALVVRGTATRVLVRAPDLLARAGHHYAAAVYRAAALMSLILGRLLSFLVALKPHSRDRRRRALTLNERGAQLSRAGEPDQAAEQHRVALAIVRDLGDQQAEALTLNSLGLALAQGGAEAAALQQFEEALAVLRRIGDKEHEGQVIANLGLVHRRQGRSEEAASLLHAALDKLPPESSAYRRVEQQLRRAS